MIFRTKDNFGSLKGKATLVAAALVALSGCGQSATDEPQSLPTETLASTLSDTSDLSNFAALLADTELGSVFDGRGVYTILAPTNEALGRGKRTAAPSDKDERATLVASIRRLILPGYVTRNAIRDAVKANDGSVKMRTLGNSLVTFTQSGDSIKVTDEGGHTATVLGRATAATNGAVLMIDAPLSLSTGPASAQ